jgi:hypothetical protein
MVSHRRKYPKAKIEQEKTKQNNNLQLKQVVHPVHRERCTK